MSKTNENRRKAHLGQKPKSSKELPAEHHGSHRLKCLVLLPFDASARSLRDTIRRIIYEEQGEPLFLDDFRPGAVWVDEVSRLIRESDAVIADVTRSNPNVLFELGMAHGLGKPIILLLSEGAIEKLPSDLLGYVYLRYTPDNLSGFSHRLGKFIGQLGQRRGTV
jgi:hypothetical protein